MQREIKSKRNQHCSIQVGELLQVRDAQVQSEHGTNMAIGQKPVPPETFQSPLKWIKMGTHPKMVPLVLTHSHMCLGSAFFKTKPFSVVDLRRGAFGHRNQRVFDLTCTRCWLWALLHLLGFGVRSFRCWVFIVENVWGELFPRWCTGK